MARWSGMHVVYRAVCTAHHNPIPIGIVCACAHWCIVRYVVRDIVADIGALIVRFRDTLGRTLCKTLLR